jgi:hypothetical protein
LESVCSFVPEQVDLYIAPLYMPIVMAMNLPETVRVHPLDDEAWSLLTTNTEVSA